MKYLKNPTDNLLELTFGPSGIGAKYRIEPQETVAFTEEAEPVADYFLEVYGFIEELSEDEVESLPQRDKYECRYCGRDCKTILGVTRHEKACDKKGEEVKTMDVRRIDIKAKSHRKSEIEKSRSQMEDEGFGNTDLSGVTAGRAVEEKVGDKKQKVVYDKDGVAWYGPGIEDDTSVVNQRKAGRFNY